MKEFEKNIVPLDDGERQKSEETIETTTPQITEKLEVDAEQAFLDVDGLKGKTQSYLNALKDAGERSGDIASLDRSEFFRHRKDFEIFAAIVREHKQNSEPIKFLEVGVGNMEEPISYLAAAQQELNGRKLEDVVDMKIVEIRSKDEVNPKYRLGKQLFAPDKPLEPKAYKDSFVLVNGEYEPNGEIKDYLTRKTEDKSSAHFDTPIENFTRTNNDRFDVVSCNNVIQHLGGIEGYSSPYKNFMGEQTHVRYYEELARILGLVKEGGVIFIHAPSPGNKFDTKSKGTGVILDKIPNFKDEFEEIAPVVYKRKIRAKEND